MVEMHMHRRQRQVVVIVKRAREALRQLAALVIIDIDKGGDAILLGVHSVARFSHASTGQIADCLRSVLIPPCRDHPVDSLNQFIVQGDRYPLHLKSPRLYDDVTRKSYHKLLAPMAEASIRGMMRRIAAGALPFVALTGAAEAQTAPPQTTPSPVTSGSPSVPSADLGEIEITAPRIDLLGTARSASEGFVDDRELQLTPIYRPGQLLETVPGLTITQHSGEGKANQFILRGYNLDHGTDLETYVDGMPINQPTHAHGQGYTDLSFMIPELADLITYTKGPYYATVGDFGAVGSARL
jgi:hypothetical protein